MPGTLLHCWNECISKLCFAVLMVTWLWWNEIRKVRLLYDDTKNTFKIILMYRENFWVPISIFYAVWVFFKTGFIFVILVLVLLLFRRITVFAEALTVTWQQHFFQAKLIKFRARFTSSDKPPPQLSRLTTWLLTLTTFYYLFCRKSHIMV